MREAKASPVELKRRFEKMMDSLMKNAVRDMKKAMRRVEAFHALSEFLSRQTYGEWFTAADIRKEYPDASPHVLAHYLSRGWLLGMRIKVFHNAVEIKCQPFTVEVYDYEIHNYKKVTIDSYKVNAYALMPSTC